MTGTITGHHVAVSPGSLESTVSVVVPGLQDDDLLVLHQVDKSMLVGDATGPAGSHAMVIGEKLGRRSGGQLR